MLRPTVFAWPLDGDRQTARVVLRQHDDEIRGEIDGVHRREFTAKVRRDVQRILCLDIDGADLPGLGRHDPVVKALQKRFAGLRPVLFSTPYEAAARCIISQRIHTSQAATIKQQLADSYGVRGAFPPPERLSAVESPQPGLSAKKIDQLHHLASATLAGALDRDTLRHLTDEDVKQRLQELPGIGPFSAELILIPGIGAPDALPQHERRLQAATCAAYQLPSNADISPIAERWRPYRSRIALLLRAAHQPAGTADERRA